MRVLESFTWLHVLIISLIGGLLTGMVVHFGRPGAFTADASLLLSDHIDPIADMTAASGTAQGGTSLERLKAILVSRALRERIVDKLNLAEKLHADRAELINRMLDMTSLKGIGEDGVIISVTVRGYANPRFALFSYPITFEEARQLCADIANAYITELGAYVRASKVATTRKTREFLEKRAEELRSELGEAEGRLEDLRAQYKLLDPQQSATRLSERIRVLEQAWADAAAEVDAIASALTEAEQQLEETDVRRISSSVETRNPLIASLEQELTQLRIDLATELAAGKTAEHHDVQQIQSAIEAAEQQIADLQETVIREIGEQPNPLYDDAIKRVVDLRVQLASARARKAETSALLADARSEMAQMPAVAREYVTIDRERQLRAEQLTTVEQALWRARLAEVHAEAIIPFTTLDQAAPPIERRGPPTVLSASIAFAALLLLQGLLIIDRRWFGG